MYIIQYRIHDRSKWENSYTTYETYEQAQAAYNALGETQKSSHRIAEKYTVTTTRYRAATEKK